MKGDETLAEGAEQTVKDAFEMHRCNNETNTCYVFNCGFACASVGLPGKGLEPAGEAI